MFLFPFHLHPTTVVTQSSKEERKWMLLLRAALVCVNDKVILVNAQDMLPLLRGVIPGTFYRLLTDISEIGCDTPNDISWGESLTDTHLEK